MYQTRCFQNHFFVIFSTKTKTKNRQTKTTKKPQEKKMSKKCFPPQNSVKQFGFGRDRGELMRDNNGQIQFDQWKTKHKNATRNRMVLINEFIVFIVFVFRQDVLIM